ncbi:SEC-C metal-binding domain-containing protein [Actinoplanes sp. HUAS TT8]|uniref:SEC-C metal-binding domain-containing protein n=1 Tax=Actinoplanes sp. HUAS TT8 TaxID=3447453 RepID=UPI003F522CDD
MLTLTDLTSADLDEIRKTALGEADPLGIAAGLAEAVDNGRLADPELAGEALILAAEIAESRSKLDAAVRYADRAVEAYGTSDDGKAITARALHARLLFRSGRADEAMAELEPLRPLLGKHNDAPAYIAAALAVGGRHRVAEEWLTEAVQAALAERTGEPSSAEDAGLLFFLLQQRHGIRHALNLTHDAHDNLADRLERRLANAGTTAVGDELLFWPQAEFDRVIAKWPALTSAYGSTWDEHRGRVERELVRLAASNPAPVSGTAAGLSTFAGLENDPADAKTRAGYTRQLTTKIVWPPERNGSCWCGSGLKYKKCCLPRGRA